MTDDMMRYDLMVEQALRTVVREAMGRVAQDGLPGEHHLYITFRTDEEGVSLPDYLIERYPDEMTIVLQHQFEDLTVDHGGFAVSLNFNNVQERLRIPFASISAFADPSANFGLQFKFEEAEENIPGQFISSETEFRTDVENDGESEEESAETAADGNVVTLDTFRKK
ncbi:MAG: ClpXP protease specificity-enhancing factor SspB [Rhodospirillaceae bacterium]|nr:ClpXP protease specificity-enhancing factor SspB [Rhodospirillaceae bacterium]